MAFTEQNTTTTGSSIHPATHMGHVHYTVANLERMMAFYQDIVGFKLHWQEGESAGLGAGRDDLLRLTQVPGAHEVPGTTGLYHTAFLVPTRWDLANLLKRIAETRTPVQGLSNHLTHHAIYLPDVEGNGIELAFDLPKEQWPTSFTEMMANHRGLHPNEVFSALNDRDEDWHGVGEETVVGHVHLHVDDLAAARHFYHDLIGFDYPLDFENAPRQLASSAAFMSAGGYHHHLAVNTWNGEGAPQPPANASGLRYFTILLPNADELARIQARLEDEGILGEQTVDGWLVHDPAHNGVMLATA
ncbi:MAG: VOC family protein [Anaerolineaceae bacterium]|nr:VOC family protein [Anaerolineaceae bacterium]